MIFGDLCKLEPRLLALYRKVQSIREQDDGRSLFCANRCWQNAKGTGLRAELRVLVGWNAGNPTLQSREAYDLAHYHVYIALPDCRDCTCPRIADFREAIR